MAKNDIIFIIMNFFLQKSHPVQLQQHGRALHPGTTLIMSVLMAFASPARKPLRGERTGVCQRFGASRERA